MKKLLVIRPFKYGGKRLEPGDHVLMERTHEGLYKHLELVIEIQKPVRASRPRKKKAA